MECGFRCEEFSQYRVDLPYPDVIVRAPNEHYARLISGAFAGSGSELTAIAQYTFHNLYTDGYPDVSAALKYIAAVEATHLRLLGKLIIQLGLTPMYGSYETETYWNGNYSDYNTLIGDLLAVDIQGERNAIAHYDRLLHQIRDESIAQLFRRILLDEERHLEVLLPLYDKYR